MNRIFLFKGFYDIGLPSELCYIVGYYIGASAWGEEYEVQIYLHSIPDFAYDADDTDDEEDSGDSDDPDDSDDFNDPDDPITYILIKTDNGRWFYARGGATNVSDRLGAIIDCGGARRYYQSQKSI